MIFVSVGTQLPFDRLAMAMDHWAADHPDEEVFMQLAGGGYVPKHGRAIEFAGPAEWDRLFHAARVVVAHAGMGTILKSLDHAKPLVVMPRLGDYGEHRNNHQVDTAKRFVGVGLIRVVNDEASLFFALDSGFSQANRAPEATGESQNLKKLVDYLRGFAANC